MTIWARNKTMGPCAGACISDLQPNSPKCIGGEKWQKRCHFSPTGPKWVRRSPIPRTISTGARSRAHRRVQRSERYKMGGSPDGGAKGRHKGIGWMEYSSSCSCIYILVVIISIQAILISIINFLRSIIVYIVLIYCINVMMLWEKFCHSSGVLNYVLEIKQEVGNKHHKHSQSLVV